LMQKTGQSV